MSCYPHQNDDRYIYAKYGLARRTIGAHNTDIMIRIVGILGQVRQNQCANDYPRYPNGLCIPTFKSQARNVFYAIDVKDSKGRYSSRYLRSLNYVLDFMFMGRLLMAIHGAMYTPFTWFVINAMNTKGADTWLLTMMYRFYEHMAVGDSGWKRHVFTMDGLESMLAFAFSTALEDMNEYDINHMDADAFADDMYSCFRKTVKQDIDVSFMSMNVYDAWRRNSSNLPSSMADDVNSAAFAFKLVSKNRDRKSYGMFADVINGFSRDSIDLSWLSSWMHDHGDMANCDFRSICNDCRDSIYGNLPALYGFMEIYDALDSYTRDNMMSEPELTAFPAVLLEDLISMIASGVSDEAIHESLMINYA